MLWDVSFASGIFDAIIPVHPRFNQPVTYKPAVLSADDFVLLLEEEEVIEEVDPV